MSQAAYKLRQMLEPLVESLGYEWVGIEFHPHRANPVLRVYIDQASGISLSDCERVSHQISGILDVEDPIPGHYTLEVSSPGLDRPLFEARDFLRFVDREVRIQLDVPVNGKRNYRGLIRAVDDDEVIIETQGERLAVRLSSIGKARLVPEF